MKELERGSEGTINRGKEEKSERRKQRKEEEKGSGNRVKGSE